MAAIPKSKMTPQEYLEFERKSAEKHEYFDGEIFLMVGAKRRHNVIVLNFGSEIRQKLKGRSCEGYANDMRVSIPNTGLYTYPELVVVCGEPNFQDDVFDTLLNPILIIEVLSETTENYDRGKKFQHYRTIETLHEYVLVSTDEARIEKFEKTGNGFWFLSEAVGIDSEIELTSIEARIQLAEIYDKIDFSVEESQA
jgi:Uma2 family endonuclease